MQQTNIGKCRQCQKQLNAFNKMPIIICQEKHSLCLQCLQQLAPPFKCPFCKVNISKEKLKLDQLRFYSLGGAIQNPLQFRYLYYKDQLRIVSNLHHKIVEYSRKKMIKTSNNQAYQTSKKILTIQTHTFIIFTVVNILMHLFLVFTEQQQCIDWNQDKNSYTIREYFKLTILINFGCFAVAATLYLSSNIYLKGFVETYGEKLIGAYIILRLISETIMWSHFMFVMQPQCSSFIFLYLHVQTFGYYIFTFLFAISFVYYYIRKQRLISEQ